MSHKILKLSENINNFDTIVIGGGAAGLFCAANLGRNGKKVILLEASPKVGAKILISGGGRCNFTNLEVSYKNYVGKNPQFARSALSQFTNRNFMELIKEYKIPYEEKTLGQLFVSRKGGANEILQMLKDLCKKAHVRIKTETEIKDISRTDQFVVTTNHAEYKADNLVIATGGKSIPKMGATSFAYEVAQQFNINVIDPQAALVPLVFSGQRYDWIKELSGVSFDGIISANGAQFKEAVLFTHKGLSGPAALQISSYIDGGNEISIDVTAGKDFIAEIFKAKKQSPNQLFATALANILPQRLARELAGEMGNQKLQALKNSDIENFVAKIKAIKLTPAGTEGFLKAEVTKGGIDTNELNQKTMECKKVEGLYFIGECVDITGWLGGYNFQWAWSSAYACANALSQ